MTTRIQTIASLLMIGAALAATPVLAAGTSTQGSHGSPSGDVGRDAPLTLPGTATPKPTPRVDSAAVGRDIFGEDPAQALENLGTVTLSNGGEVTETPASDALRDIFQAAIAGHKPGN